MDDRDTGPAPLLIGHGLVPAVLGTVLVVRRDLVYSCAQGPAPTGRDGNAAVAGENTEENTRTA